MGEEGEEEEEDPPLPPPEGLHAHDDGAESAAAASTAAFEDFQTSFEERLEKFKNSTEGMQAAEMEPLLRRYFKDSEISNYWNKLKREISRYCA